MVLLLWVSSTFTAKSIYQVACSQLLVGVYLVILIWLSYITSESGDAYTVAQRCQGVKLACLSIQGPTVAAAAFNRIFSQDGEILSSRGLG